MPVIPRSLSNMAHSIRWVLTPRDGDHSSSPESDGSSTATYNGGLVPTDTFAEDLFQDKFMKIARGGSNGEKIMRGFLIGVAIGLIVACFVCCWYPCCRPNRPRRRRGPRRPPVGEMEETTNSPEQPAESTVATTTATTPSATTTPATTTPATTTPATTTPATTAPAATTSPNAVPPA